MEVRPYDPERDAGPLWELKRRFETELGAGTGDDGKRERYEGKLTDAYRERYLDWVGRCVADDERCVTVAAPPPAACAGPPVLNGYAFVLPERLAMVWDAAVLNEVYVREAHRGTGLADRLLEAAVELAAEQDTPLDRLVLDVDPDNDRAVGFYERHGFEPWGEMLAREL